jgi:L-threonylcarbamoyladenylate synthase
MAVQRATPEAISCASRILQRGGLVAFPTETVYGLGADATQGRAVAAIFEAKGRPRFNPLIVHVADVAAARRLGQFGPLAERLAQAFWPGPLTLVVRRAAVCQVSELATAGLATIALRVPRHLVARALLAEAGVPVAAPSANRSGRVSPTTARHVAADLGETVELILDGGPAEVGLESTVVDASGAAPVLLRLGGVTAAEIEAATGLAVRLATDGRSAPQSPGQLLKHYAPDVPVRLEARTVEAGEALLAFGPTIPAAPGPVFNLSPGGDLREAAANLFAGLRALDRPGVTAIAVMPIPGEGLGAAINDRLARAARR